MNNIFGIYYRLSRQKPSLALEKMYIALITRQKFNSDLWSDHCVGLGQSLTRTSPDTPELVRSRTNTLANYKFIAAGRLDNASELFELLDVPKSQRSLLSDYELMRLAYNTWGDACSAHLYGDWALAAWHPLDNRIFLSRDHHGNTSLYYYIDKNIFAFASSRQALLSLNLVPVELDELYLAQYLISWPDYHGERTLHKPIRRLPPAHSLSVTEGSHTLSRYWRLEDTPELHLPHRKDYVDAFRPLFDEAVRCRLRSNGPVAVTLSGGLDSSSVAVTAAEMLKKAGQQLTAFTSVPFFKNYCQQTTRIENEFEYAQAIANFSGNINLHPLTSIEISPISAIQNVIRLNCDPCHGASNLYWLTDILKFTAELDCHVLLTGSSGNGGVSWTGDLFSQSWPFLMSHMHWSQISRTLSNRTKQKIKSVIPNKFLYAIQQYRTDQKLWMRKFAIHPDFAGRLHLFDQRMQSLSETHIKNPRELQYQILMPGRSIGGSYEAELCGAYGLEVRDPTADARVLAFTCSIPDHIFIDPNSGMDRWLIREAMKGRLPNVVRLNKKRGRQAADLILRLRACAPEVEVALAELSCGPAAAYVDVEYMRKVWKQVQADDTRHTFIIAGTILTRGIMAGLFVNKFYE